MCVFEIRLQFMYEFAFELFKYLLHTWDYVSWNDANIWKNLEDNIKVLFIHQMMH